MPLHSRSGQWWHGGLMLLACAAMLTAGAATAAAEPHDAAGLVDLPGYPSVSPDGSQIVFSWRGDLWRVSSQGGEAVRITRHRGDDLRSAWSRDGEHIAFSSTRSGFLNLHIMRADGTGVRQLTHVDQPCVLAGFGADEAGEPVVTFAASVEGESARMLRPYSISLQGGDLVRVHDALGSHPVVSPSGRFVAFTRGVASWRRRNSRNADTRDVWVFDRVAKTFTPITTRRGNDGHARWRNDDELLYLSDRELDCVNLYRVKVGEALAAGTLDPEALTHERLTSFTQADVQDFNVSADGSTAVFVVWDTLYRLDLATVADPTPVVMHAATDDDDNFVLQSVDRAVTEAALSPDGKVMALVARGEVYLRHIDDHSPTVRVTHTAAREKEIVWSPDGLRLYFTSNRDGADAIYYATAALTRSDIKDAFAEATKLPTPEDEPSTEVATAHDEPAKHDASAAVAPTQPAAEPAPPTAPASEEEPPAVEPDEPKATPQDDPAPAKPEKSEEKAEETKPVDKARDPKRWHDAVRFEIVPLVQSPHSDSSPSPSPDGRSLAFLRSPGNLMILDLASGAERVLVDGWSGGMHWSWRSDSAFIAYSTADRSFNYDIWIVPADGSAQAVNISRHPNYDVNPRWSADGRILSFISRRVNNQYDLYSVYLDKDLEALSRRELDAYFEEAIAAAKKRKPLAVDDAPAKSSSPSKPLDLADAYLRLRRITSSTESEGQNAMTPAGDRFVYVANKKLHSIKWDGSDVKTWPLDARVQHMTLTGDKVVFVASHRAGTAPVGGGSAPWIDIRDQMRIDLREQASQKFLEIANLLGETFYHPTMKDLDWPALTQRYHALAVRTRTPREFDDVANRFLGELNASHLGVRTPDNDPSGQPYGRLGTVHRRGADGFEVIEVIPETPADKGTMRLEPGDIITAIELQPLGPADTIESALQGRIGEETIVTIRRQIAGEARTFDVLLRPIAYREFADLCYRAWRRNNARLVSDWSGGRVGYIHIRSMNESSLEDFERDLYAAAGDKDGLIIDVRNNGGGWTADRLLASIMVKPHAYTVPRGAEPIDTSDAYPQDRLFIQRYTLPINTICNEFSFSNAEIFSHAFKTLERGTLVGQQTAGGVISTGSHRLIDGTTVRTPFRGWYLPDGTDMENHGAMPDILIEQTPQMEAAGEDVQLHAAVEDLMKRL